MAFTRFHDDPCRINKQLQESTGLGRYMLNVPGNGSKPLYMDDPYIRMQKWGGNLMTNTVNLESDLFGLTRNTNHDDITKNEYRLNAVKSEKQEYHSRAFDRSIARHAPCLGISRFRTNQMGDSSIKPARKYVLHFSK